MRSLVFALALLLLLPAGMAEHGPEGSHGAGQGNPQNGTAAENGTAPRGNASAGPCGDAEDRRGCVRDYCDQRPDEPRCQQFDECSGSDCAPMSPTCLEEDRRSMRACEALHELESIRVGSRHVAFVVEDDGRRLVDYSADGRILVESITYGHSNESFDVDRDGARIRFESESARLEIHDTPTGEFWFRGGAGDHLVLIFPADAAITPSPRGHLVDYGDRTARIAGANISIEGTMVTATEHFSFFSPSGRGPAMASEALAQAKASQHVGAEISLRSPEPDVTAYDDVNISISMPAVITANDTLRVRLGAELSEGRTFVFDIDPARLGGPDLRLRYFDVHGDNETEVVFRQADGLDDVLDPGDDGGQPEYWVVEDEQGLHVMASVPVWSVHIIELASVGEFLVQPSVLLGVAAGIVGVAVAGTAMFWPRRVEDEF